MNSKTNEIKDIYEATYYSMLGATFVSARERTICWNKFSKKGYKKEWLITMAGVTHSATMDWKTYKAKGNLREFSNARVNLKRKIKKYLENKHANRD